MGNKPNLYKTVMKGLAFDDIVELNKASYEKAKELQEKFNDGKKTSIKIYKKYDEKIRK